MAEEDVGYKYKDMTFKDKIFTFMIHLILIVLSICFLYPFINVMAQSVSNGLDVMAGNITFYPIGFNIEAYKIIFRNPVILTAVMNTIYYVVVGVVTNLVLSSFVAYALSKKRLIFRNGFSVYLAITMLFSGGLIPTFLVVSAVGLYDTRAAMIIPGLFGVWNIILLRTFYQGIPESLEDSAKIDGAGDITVMFKIFMPLSKPILATLALLLAVGFWNSFFDALIYLDDRSKYPLQLVLRNVLIENDISSLNLKSQTDDNLTQFEIMQLQLLIRYAIIVITTLPIIILFIPVQKYFIKGIVLGGIKG
jgi:putative aldouronate transport system permease protein